MPVLGSGHPQADIFILKPTAQSSEIEEGVAFFGRSGQALIKALKRLQIDPLAIYGTVAVKCPVSDPSLADPECIARISEEIAIVQPKIVVAMGEDCINTLNELALPLAREVSPTVGEIQKLTPSIDLIYTPSIDQSLDEEGSKQEFWKAFRVLGQWYEDLPPY